MLKAYAMLTKPGIILGNLITTAGGFALATQGFLDFSLFFYTLIGLGLVIASACVFNNGIDRQADQKMERTKHRALAQGIISLSSAIAFATLLGLAGSVVLALYTNWIALAVTLIGFFFYVVMYSLSKYRSSSGTLIGSIAGAVPPVVGYTAVSGHFDWIAALLFILLVLWQMPHFYSIAILRQKEYAAANIPVLPVVKGLSTTKKTMLCYIIAFTLATLLLPVKYFLLATLFSVVWLLLSYRGFKAANDMIWARQMFRFSLILIILFSAVIAL